MYKMRSKVRHENVQQFNRKVRFQSRKQYCSWTPTKTKKKGKKGEKNLKRVRIKQKALRSGSQNTHNTFFNQYS